jgi:hypothetical protein
VLQNWEGTGDAVDFIDIGGADGYNPVVCSISTGQLLCTNPQNFNTFYVDQYLPYYGFLGMASSVLGDGDEYGDVYYDATLTVTVIG